MNEPNDSSERLGIRIGRAVREARTRRKMKLTDLAREVGRTAAQISTLERGIYQWTDSVLEACAAALELPLATLFADDDQLVFILPENPEAREQARRLAERMEGASADELRGMLVWSELYRDRMTTPPVGAEAVDNGGRHGIEAGNGSARPRRNGVNGASYGAHNGAT